MYYSLIYIFLRFCSTKIDLSFLQNIQTCTHWWTPGRLRELKCQSLLYIQLIKFKGNVPVTFVILPYMHIQ